jgi:hypothetical protein
MLADLTFIIQASNAMTSNNLSVTFWEFISNSWMMCVAIGDVYAAVVFEGNGKSDLCNPSHFCDECLEARFHLVIPLIQLHSFENNGLFIFG